MLTKEQLAETTELMTQASEVITAQRKALSAASQLIKSQRATIEDLFEKTDRLEEKIQLLEAGHAIPCMN